MSTSASSRLHEPGGYRPRADAVCGVILMSVGLWRPAKVATGATWSMPASPRIGAVSMTWEE
jgi:hypothetical protein